MKIQLEDFLVRKGKNSRPIPDISVIKFIDNEVNSIYLYDEYIVPTFINAYYSWIKSSKLNKFEGLDKFPALDYMHGTSQTFDFFYLKHHTKRFRCLRGEYIYHKVSWQNHFPWKYIEDEPLQPGDAVVISVPFSDLGAKHPRTDEIIKTCNELNIPVLIDAAYYCISRDLYFNVDEPCIDTIAFSLSKAFYGAERLRLGLRCRREREDDGAVLFNDFHSVPKISAGVGLKLLDNFDADYTQNKYRDKQIEVCKELNLTPSNCITFGITDKTHPEFGSYDRGTDWRRVCISKLIGGIDEIEL